MVTVEDCRPGNACLADDCPFCSAATWAAQDEPQQPLQTFGAIKLADLMTPRLRGRYRWCKELGWLWFDGTKWAPDADAAVLAELVATIKDYTKELLESRKTGLGREECAEIAGFSSGTQQNQAMKIARCAPGVVAAVAEFDPPPKKGQPWLLPCANGWTIEMHADGTVSPRKTLPTDMNTKTACAYEPKAKAPNIAKAFKDYQPDANVRRFMMQVWARGLSGMGLEKFIVNYGSTGGNGKGTMTGLVSDVAGAYAADLPVEVILKGTRNAREVYRSELAALRGARLVFADEPEAESRYSLGMLKKITGGGTLQGRAMGREAITFRPHIVFQMDSNNRPTWPTDGGMDRRYIEIPWTFKVDDKAIRESFKEDLKAEASGFLNEILRHWQGSAQLDVPEAISEQTDDGKRQSSPAFEFTRDALTKIEGGIGTCTAKAMYSAYEEWCRQNGRRVPVSSKVLGLELPKLGYEKVRKTAGMFYVGVAISDEYVRHQP